MRKSMGSRIFDCFNIIFMLLIIFATAYPIYYVIIASFSDPGTLSRTAGMLWAPIKPFTLDAYRMLFKNPLIFSGFFNTIFILVVGLAVNMTLTTLGAYLLSLKGPMLKTPVTFMIWGCWTVCGL